MYLVDRIKKSTAILLVGGLLSTGCATHTNYRNIKAYPDNLPKINFSNIPSSNFNDIKRLNQDSEELLNYIGQLDSIRTKIINNPSYNAVSDLSRLEKRIMSSSVSSKDYLSNYIRNYGYFLEQEVTETYGLKSNNKEGVKTAILIATIIGMISSFEKDKEKSTDDSTHYSIDGGRFLGSMAIGLSLNWLIESSENSSRKKYNRKVRINPLLK
jgi:hypothetical protein